MTDQEHFSTAQSTSTPYSESDVQTARVSKPSMDILVTKRMTLRPPLEVDADAIVECLSNTEVARMITGAPSPYTHADAMEFIQQAREAGSYFSIYRERFLGIVSIRAANGSDADLGFWLDPQVWRQGLMSEAARAVVSWYFRKSGASVLHSGHYEDNLASAAILEKLGFEATGERMVTNNTRMADVSMKRMELSRARFEAIFGALDDTLAA